MKTDPLIAHVEPLFDIVGKLVENVTFIPRQSGDAAQIRIDFSDGSYIEVLAMTDFTSVTDGKC